MNAQELARLERLKNAVYKLAGWHGYDISDMYEDGYLEEGDMD